MPPLAPLTHEHCPKIPDPTDRTLNPLDPRERYRTEFTQAPVHIPFAPTGSFNYSNGVYNGRLMTLKEQRFEQFVNAVQARHDELSDLVEWRRRKDVEEEAISVYFELDQDLQLFIEQMKTFDQQETEYQCQRKGLKLRCLYPERFPKQLRPWELKRQEKNRTQEHKATLSDEEKRRQFVKQVRLHAEASRNNSQAASAPGAGSSRQQKLKATLSDEEKHRQGQDQVRPHLGTSHDSNQLASSAAAGPSKQQGYEVMPSAKRYGHLQSQEKSSLMAIHINHQLPSLTEAGISSQQAQSQSQDQVRTIPARATTTIAPMITAIQSVTPETVASTQVQNELQLSPETTRIDNQVPYFGEAGLSMESHLQDQARMMPARATPSPIKEAISPVTAETAAAAQRAYKMEFDGPVPAASKDSFTAELSGYQPRMGICHGVHYPKGAVLVNTGPGLAKMCLGGPTVVTQSLATDIGQGLQGHHATVSDGYPSTGASSHDTSSQGSTPPSSLHSSPPKTPIMYPLNDAPAMRATTTQYEEADNVALFRQLEGSAYGSVKSTNLFAKQKASRRDDPFITSVLQGQLERMKTKAATEEFHRDWPRPHQQDDGYGCGRQQQQQGWRFGAESGIWGHGPWN